jgi:hypothetical protein
MRTVVGVIERELVSEESQDCADALLAIDDTSVRASADDLVPGEDLRHRHATKDRVDQHDPSRLRPYLSTLEIWLNFKAPVLHPIAQIGDRMWARVPTSQ